MTQSSGIVTLQNGDWTDAFQRLNELGGGVISVPPGTHDCEPSEIDLAEYDSINNNFGIRGAGMGTSKLDFGSGPGDGFTLADSNGGDFFYIEITGVGFQGQREGVLFRLGRDDHADAYNSCTLAFGTNKRVTGRDGGLSAQPRTQYAPLRCTQHIRGYRARTQTVPVRGHPRLDEQPTGTIAGPRGILTGERRGVAQRRSLRGRRSYLRGGL